MPEAAPAVRARRKKTHIIAYDPRPPHPVRVERHKHGLSTAALALISGIPGARINQIERRAITRIFVDEVAALARALDVPWPALVDDCNIVKPPFYKTARARE